MDGFYQTVWFFFPRHVINPRDGPLFHHVRQIYFPTKIRTIDLSLSLALSFIFFPQNSLLPQKLSSPQISLLSVASVILLTIFWSYFVVCFFFFSTYRTMDRTTHPHLPSHTTHRHHPDWEIGRLREVEIEIERGRRSGEGGGLLFGDF
jgi:hypothetical protein